MLHISWCWILCSHRCPCRSGHHVPINLHKNKCYSLFCNILSKSCNTLKGHSLENYTRKGRGGIKFCLQASLLLLTFYELLLILLVRGPKSRLSPSEIQTLAKRRGSLCGPVALPGSAGPAPSLCPPTSAQAQPKRQISAGGALRARCPDPAQLSSLREPGAQVPAGPQAPQAVQTGGWVRGLHATQGDCCRGNKRDADHWLSGTHKGQVLQRNGARPAPGTLPFHGGLL